MISMTLELDNGQTFTVDRYMNIYFEPYEGAKEDTTLFKFHVSNLNYSCYPKIYENLVAYELELGLNDPMPYKTFLNIAERLFEMYDILRKL